MLLTIPEPALVLLVGPAGSGKSTFAEAHFKRPEVVSSDAIREMLTDDAGDQGASAEAFQVLAFIVNGRMRRRLTTVIDATNLRAASRKQYLRVAARFGVPAVAVAFDLSRATYQQRNAGRSGRVVADHVVTDQAERMRDTLAELADEGYVELHVLDEEMLARGVTVERDSNPIRHEGLPEAD